MNRLTVDLKKAYDEDIVILDNKNSPNMILGMEIIFVKNILLPICYEKESE